jgi:hypothetical protein
MKNLRIRITGLLLLLSLATCFCQETCLKNAWEAYNKREWKLAIQHAEDCVFTFNSQAQEIQKQLESSGYKLPANYTVAKALSPQQKNEIFSHGLLNDVAVSYWIVGMANMRLGNSENAKKAFQNAAQLTFALCYDPSDFFWSVSQDAKARLNP